MAPVANQDEVMPARRVKAWDLPTRLFHWGLVLLVLDAWLSFRFSEAVGDNSLQWHRYNGYAVLVLLVFRVLWGFLGSSTSRFRAFLRWPHVAFDYGIGLLGGDKRHYLGHNPLGTWMIILLFLILLLQASLGLFVLDHNGINAGPLQVLISDERAKDIGRWHRRIFNFILGFAALHVTANVLYWLIRKDPLIRAMVTGTKPAADYVDEWEAELAPNLALRATICLVAAILIVLGGVYLASGQV